MQKIHTPLLLAEKGDKRYLNARLRRLDATASLEGTPDPGTKWIPLLRGKYAIVDEADYEFLNQWTWYLNHNGYAVRRETNGLRRNCFMHRAILSIPEGMYADHRNHLKTDNRRCNLRVCTHQENHRNEVKRRGMTSKFKGVHWCKRSRLFVAGAKINNRWKGLGYFKTEEEAALAYNEAARIHYGEFACLNEI